MKNLPNILIVDDSKENLFLLVSVLREINVNLIQAISGFEALEKSVGIELALAIIDVRMPVMNGYELAIKLNENRTGDKVPVIFLTASNIDELEVFKGYSYGAVDYMFKPFNAHVLLCKTNVFLDLFNQKQVVRKDAELLKISAEELIQVNAALKISEEKYRSYIDKAPEGVFVTDETGKYIEVNDAASLITGYTKDELLTMYIPDMLFEESLHDGLVQFNKVVKTGVSKADLPFRHKNGSKRWWTIESVKLSESRFLGITNDITELKELEESLRSYQIELEMQNDELMRAKEQAEEASQKYSNLFDFAPSGFFTLSLENLIQELNHSGAQMLGKDRKLLIGSHFGFFVSKNTLPAFNAFFQKVFNGNAKEICEVMLETLGEPRYVHIEGMLIGNGKQCLLNVIDITRRKKAESDVQDAHWRLESIIEGTHVGTWEWNVQTGEAVFNDIWAELFGYTLDELYPMSINTWEAFLHPDDRKQSEDLLARHFSGELPYFDCESRMQHKDGRWVWIHDRGRIITRTDEGKPLMMFGTHTDITERKQAEEALKQTTARFELAVKAGGVGVWDMDIETAHLLWDDHMFSLYGHDKVDSSLAYKSWLAGVHPDDKEQSDAEIQMAIRGEKEFDTEFRVCWPDNSIHTIRANGIVMRDHAGKPFRMIGTNWDITEQKRLEEKLKSSEVNFRTFFETMNDMVIVGNMQGEIIYVNEALCTTLGYTKEDLQGMQVLNLNPEGMRAEAEQIFSDMFAGKRDSCPLPLARKNGSYVPVETHVWFGKWDGKDCIFGLSKNLSAEQEALQKFNKIFDNNPALIAISSVPEGIFTDVNDTFLSKIGYAKEDIIGKTAEELGLFIESEKQKHASIELARKGFIHNLELEVNTSSGKILNGLFSGEIIESQGVKFFLTVMVDITERKQAEDILRNSEINLAEAQRIAHIGSWEWDMLTGALKWSKEMYRVFDISPETFDGKPESVLKVLHPDDVELLTSHKNSNLFQGDALSSEYRVIHHDGSVHNIVAEGKLEFDKSGKPVKSIGTVQDITERKRTEAEMNRQREILQGIFDHIPVMITYFDKEGNIKIVNQELVNKLGWTLEEWETENILEQCYPKPEVYKEMIEFMSKKRLGWKDFTTATKFRTVIETTWTNISLPNGDLLGIGQDITKRKQAEQTLKISEEKYRTMLNASPDGIFLTDRKGRITDVSEIGIELFGFENREELLGKHFSVFIPVEEKQTYREVIEKTMNEGIVQNVEIKIRRKNYTVFLSEASSTLIQGADGMLFSFMIIIRDISQRKKMETKQIHADRMANLGEMASGIAHEINQPLNIISMVMDKLLYESTKTESIDVAFLKNKSDKIFENIIRIRNIIDHVRAFSRSHDDYVLTAFDINSSIESAVSMITEQFKHLGIILNLQLDKLIPQLYGNTYKFEQVIVNLLVNAKDAVIERKSKYDEYNEMVIGIKSYVSNQFLIVEVTDNGSGISEQDINHVVLPFYTTKDEGKGTGLGLSICYQIIKEMNGTIDISSDSMRGTKIKLVLDTHKEK